MKIFSWMMKRRNPGMGGIGAPISEKITRKVRVEDRCRKRQESSLDWKPLLATVLVIGTAAFAIFSSDDEVVPVQEKPVEEVFIPEIQTKQ